MQSLEGKPADMTEAEWGFIVAQVARPGKRLIDMGAGVGDARAFENNQDKSN